MKRDNIKTPIEIIRSLSGFTLIEIILVVIVLSIIVAVSIPNFSNVSSSLVLKKQAEDISLLMRYAQSRAITKSRYVKLEFDDDKGTYRLLESTEDDIPSVSNMTFDAFSSRFARINKINNKLKILKETDEIIFYPDGTMDKVSIDVCNRNKCYVVSTKIQRGFVRMYEKVTDE